MTLFLTFEDDKLPRIYPGNSSIYVLVNGFFNITTRCSHRKTAQLSVPTVEYLTGAPQKIPRPAHRD